MTGKERAAFRRQANSLEAIFQIGKEGLSVPLLQGIDKALEKRELVKISVLDSCEEPLRSCAERCAQALEAEVIQCIGKKFVLYRQKSEEDK